MRNKEPYLIVLVFMWVFLAVVMIQGRAHGDIGSGMVLGIAIESGNTNKERSRAEKAEAQVTEYRRILQQQAQLLGENGFIYISPAPEKSPCTENPDDKKGCFEFQRKRRGY